MSTTSISANAAVARSIGTQTGINTRTAAASSDGSFSSQVAAIWNQASYSSGAAGSASSANLKDRLVVSSASASHLPGQKETDVASKQEETQARKPVSMSQTMQPAFGQNPYPSVDTGGGGTPAAKNGAADVAGLANLPIEDGLVSDTPQPDVRNAAGAPTRSTRRSAQTTGARPDDGSTAPASPPLPPAGADVSTPHLSDVTSQPSPGIRPSDGSVTMSKDSRPADDSGQPASTDASRRSVVLDQRSAHSETGTAAGAGAGSQLGEHHGFGSANDVPVQANAADGSSANSVSASPLLSAMEPVALGTALVDSSPPAAAGTSATLGQAPTPAAETSLDAAGAPAQVGASLLTLASGTDGSSQLALSLHPKDLGGVHIQLARGADGAVQVVVAATEPATLRSLIADQAHLHAALDAAAVPTTDRHVSFELAPASASPDSAATADRQPGSFGSPDGRAAMDTSGQDNGRRSGDGRPDRPADQDMAAISDGGFDRPSPFSSKTTLLLRQGSINITA